MKIIGWGRCDNEKYGEFCGSEEALAEQEVIKEIKKNQYLFDGYYHQYGEFGTPIFDNGKQFTTTMRNWGAIMEECHPELLSSYIDMYCGQPSEEFKDLIKYPEGAECEG